MSPVRILFAAALLLPAATFAYDGVSAAVEFANLEGDFRFEDGAAADLRLRRAGIEYLETVAPNVWLGFSLGYSESERRGRLLESAAGNFGSLKLHVDVPFSRAWSMYGRAEYLLQRDRRGSSASQELEVRLYETRAEAGPRWRHGLLDVIFGGTWHSIDYRETVLDSLTETVRRADLAEQAGAFAALGLRTDNDGTISLRYQDGAAEGWVLRFERTFR